MQTIHDVAIAQIQVGRHEKRVDQEDVDVDELAASIRNIGIIQPLILEKEGDTFHLVAGHRRLLAATRVGLPNVPCIVQDCDQARSTETAFAENFFRRNLTAVELAAAIRGCIDDKIMTIAELAKGMHKSEQWICDQAKMTTWAPEVLQAIHVGAISVSAARNLAAVTDARYRKFLLHNAVENGVTARVTAAWLQAWQLSRPPEAALSTAPADGPAQQPPVVPQAPCLFCSNVYRTDALNYMPVCGQCLADFQQARARVDKPVKGV